MLPIRHYTVEDFYKFYEIITPFLDKHLTYHDDFWDCYHILVEIEELRTLLKDAFPIEADSLPSVFLNFVNLMMNEMNCVECYTNVRETGRVWYNIEAYIRMKEREMYCKK